MNRSQKNWPQLLDVAQFCFNSQLSSSTGKSPFEVVTGRSPRLPHIVAEYGGKNPKAFLFSQQWEKNIDIARAYLEKACKRMKKWADKGRRPLEFQVGDKVLLKLTAEQFWFIKRHDQRLLRKYEGPFVVTAKVGRASYRINPPEWLKVHPVFHVSCLKPYHEDQINLDRNQPSRPAINFKPAKRPEVEAILADREIVVNRQPRR